MRPEMTTAVAQLSLNLDAIGDLTTDCDCREYGQNLSQPIEANARGRTEGDQVIDGEDNVPGEV
jgi:hypothetical protein